MPGGARPPCPSSPGHTRSSSLSPVRVLVHVLPGEGGASLYSPTPRAGAVRVDDKTTQQRSPCSGVGGPVGPRPPPRDRRSSPLCARRRCCSGAPSLSPAPGPCAHVPPCPQSRRTLLGARQAELAALREERWRRERGAATREMSDGSRKDESEGGRGHTENAAVNRGQEITGTTGGASTSAGRCKGGGSAGAQGNGEERGGIRGRDR